MHGKKKAVEVYPAHPPVAAVQIQGRSFLASKIITQEGKRDCAILYTRDSDGDLVARLAYHSKSDGSWRITPHVEPNGRLSKGTEAHYTQETKPHISIVSMLDDLKEKLQSNALRHL